MNDTLAALTAEIRSRVEDLGYELWDLRRRGSGKRISLQVRVDRPDAAPGRGITIDECAAVSRALEEWLDEEQPLGARYVLEVSSPGIERPVRWREHWERFAGRQVQVKRVGHPRMRATVVAMLGDADAVVLRPIDGGQDMTVPLEEISEATLAVDWTAVERSMADAPRNEQAKEQE
ncbi:MAG: ribosome maturation factor RimP [Gemmatimonadota bacterium]|nr:MAG: ribosome maturation factor RimP [Gemmatimonadota bacterium]